MAVIFCSNCSIPLDRFDMFEGAEGLVYTCPECGEAVMYQSYGAKPLECSSCVTTSELFTQDEKTYLNHIIDKQISKLESAEKTLRTAKDKINGEA